MNSADNISRFHPESYMDIIHEGQKINAKKVYSVKEYNKLFENLRGKLSVEDEWKNRIDALYELQGLVCGDGIEFETLKSDIKGIHELISEQIIDLRSLVSKEASRTIAIFARRLGYEFNSIAEFFVPALLKTTIVKISVVANAAEKTLRCLMTATSQGYPSILPKLFEAAEQKVPILRKLSVEYLSLAVSTWPADITERNLSSYKKVLESCLSDADSSVRKASRTLFWTMHHKTWLKEGMENFLQNLDGNVQKHMHTEVHRQSPDLLALLNPPALPDEGELPPQVDKENKNCKVNNGRGRSSGRSSVREGLSNTTVGSNSMTARGSKNKNIEKNNREKNEGDAGSENRIPLSSRNRSGANGAIGRKGGIATASRVSSSGSSISRDVSSGNTSVRPSGSGPQRGPQRVVRGQDSNISEDILNNNSGYNTVTVKGMQMSVRVLRGPQRQAQPHGQTQHSSSRLDREVKPSSSSVATKSKSNWSTTASNNNSVGGLGVVSSSSSNNTSTTSSTTSVSAVSSSASSLTSAPSGGLLGGVKRVLKAPQRQAVKSSTQTQSSAAAAAPADSSVPVLATASSSMEHACTESQSQLESSSSSIERDTSNLTDISSISVNVVSNVTQELTSHSMDELRSLLSSAHWTQRLKGFSELRRKLESWTWSAGTGKNTGRPLSEAIAGSLLDLLVNHLDDANARVNTQAMECLHNIIADGSNNNNNGETVTQTQILARQKLSMVAARLGTILCPLFCKLGDRRPIIREQANNLLNHLRANLDSVALLAALAPRITEFPDRVKTAALQFLMVIVPHCTDYFCVASNTSMLLQRIAGIMAGYGSKGSQVKPSLALCTAIHRLLELIYRTNPEMVLQQIALMSLQQQNLIKDQLVDVVNDIHALVAHAARQAHAHTGSNNSNSNINFSSDGKPTNMVISPNTTIHNNENEKGSEKKKESRENKSKSNELSSSRRISVPNRKAPPPPVPTSNSNSCSSSASVSHATVDLPVPPFMAKSEPTQSAVVSHAVPVVVPPVPPSTGVYSPDKYAVNIEVNISKVLEALHPCQTDVELKVEALKQVKTLIKSASDDFWRSNCAQILSVLLEAFHPAIIAQLGQATITIGNSNSNVRAIPYKTSISPESSRRGLLDSPDAIANNNNVTDMSKRLTGLTPQSIKTTGEIEENLRQMSPGEVMHWACKIILLLVQHRGSLVKGFIELLVSRLCETSTVAPVAVVLHCQQILCDLASMDASSAHRMLLLLLPYVKAPIRLQMKEQSSSTFGSGITSESKTGSILAGGARLMALQVLSTCVKNMTSSLLLKDLKEICAAVLPLFGSAVVDERKAVVFILVEMYMVVGDALHPYVNGLPAQQRKLLTVYIDKQLAT